MSSTHSQEDYLQSKRSPLLESEGHRRLAHVEVAGAAYFITWSTQKREVLPPIARTATVESLRHLDGARYQLWAAVVMPDHVHVLLEPLATDAAEEEFHSLSSILHSIKSYSAHQINKLLQRTGPVWQRSRYDRVIRSDRDLSEKLDYLIYNPIKAGLADHLADYPWLYVLEPAWIAE